MFHKKFLRFDIRKPTPCHTDHWSDDAKFQVTVYEMKLQAVFLQQIAWDSLKFVWEAALCGCHQNSWLLQHVFHFNISWIHYYCCVPTRPFLAWWMPLGFSTRKHWYTAPLKQVHHTFKPQLANFVIQWSHTHYCESSQLRFVRCCTSWPN